MPFSTPLICCSRGVATDASTSVALAPMNVVVTWIIGGTISGYWATGSPRIATTPSSTVMIDKTIATIGRFTKNRAITLRGDRGGAGRLSIVDRPRLRPHRHAVPDRLESLGD